MEVQIEDQAAPMAGHMEKPLGVILAGGRATRMGGGDKGLLAVGPARILDHVIARLSPQCATLALNANGDPTRFGAFGLPVVQDSIPGYPGPLAGILAGMDWAFGLGADTIVTVSADTPFLPTDLVARLIAQKGPQGLCLAASPDQNGILRQHPTFGLWPVALRHELRAALQQGLRKVMLWCEQNQAGQALFSSDGVDPFFNINTPEDLAMAQRLRLV